LAAARPRRFDFDRRFAQALVNDSLDEQRLLGIEHGLQDLLI
jgi:hypothetical protein